MAKSGKRAHHQNWSEPSKTGARTSMLLSANSFPPAVIPCHFFPHAQLWSLWAEKKHSVRALLLVWSLAVSCCRIDRRQADTNRFVTLRYSSPSHAQYKYDSRSRTVRSVFGLLPLFPLFVLFFVLFFNNTNYKDVRWSHRVAPLFMPKQWNSFV